MPQAKGKRVTDKERLDWLGEFAWKVQLLDEEGPIWLCLDGEGQEFRAKSPRQAIDAAIAASKKSPRKGG